jgi:hypothetical protein
VKRYRVSISSCVNGPYSRWSRLVGVHFGLIDGQPVMGQNGQCRVTFDSLTTVGLRHGLSVLVEAYRAAMGEDPLYAVWMEDPQYSALMVGQDDSHLTIRAYPWEDPDTVPPMASRLSRWDVLNDQG